MSTATMEREEVTTVPALLSGKEAQSYLGLSKSGWFRARSAGLLPAPVHVPGSGDKWRRVDLDAWLAKLAPRRRMRAGK